MTFHFMEKKKPITLIYAIGAIVLSILVVIVSLLPKQELPSTSVFQADKLVHFSMYFVLSILYFKGFFEGKSVSFLTPIVIAFCLSFAVEIMQHYCTTTRSFDKFDILANGIGCFFAFLGIKYIFNHSK
ncbi:MAG: VanZ family protein [Chitinophagales bacterium]